MPTERTFALIKGGAVYRRQAPAIMDAIRQADLKILTSRRFDVNDHRRFQRLYAAHKGKPYYQGLLGSVEGGSLALVLEGKNAVATWREMMGPTDPAVARETAPGSLRALYGKGLPDNAVHGSDSVESAALEIHIFFPRFTPKGLLVATATEQHA